MLHAMEDANELWMPYLRTAGHGEHSFQAAAPAAKHIQRKRQRSFHSARLMTRRPWDRYPLQPSSQCSVWPAYTCTNCFSSHWAPPHLGSWACSAFSPERRNRTPACLHAPGVEVPSKHQPDSPRPLACVRTNAASSGQKGSECSVGSSTF